MKCFSKRKMICVISHISIFSASFSFQLSIPMALEEWEVNNKTLMNTELKMNLFLHINGSKSIKLEAFNQFVFVCTVGAFNQNISTISLLTGLSLKAIIGPLAVLSPFTMFFFFMTVT